MTDRHDHSDFAGLESFRAFRAEMNERLIGAGHLGIKRFLALDGQAYQDGALDERVKEMLGLVASLVLRCDDCVTYHLERCVGLSVTREECLEVFNIGLVVGGSIVIPHLRRALRTLDALLAERASGS
ncbi:MAG TPA: carboxymuconolactone decarboxylase family protein [Gemmatimonadota bacterium]|nr:carboxymuconolactone decarboxylase family protein [Gemmatimonadota bacterium]